MSTTAQTTSQVPSQQAASGDRSLVTVVIPCLNEAETIERCVTRARAALTENGIAGEVLVVDNGSDNGSETLASDAGALVVQEPRRGYGSAPVLTGTLNLRSRTT